MMCRYAFILLGLMTIVGCTYDFPVPEPEPEIDTGEANFDRFTIIGGSVAAGQMDGALYADAQRSAYPAILGHFLEKNLNRELYSTLEVASEWGYNYEAEELFSEEAGRYELSFRSPEETYPARMPTEGEAPGNFTKTLTGVANLSIPGLRITEVDSAEALSGNPYFDRLDSRDAGKSILDIAIERNPTLMVLQLGTADLFNYVTAGAAGEESPPQDNIAADDLTPVPVFEQHLERITNRILSESDSDIILSTIPDPLKMPYVNTIPWNFSRDEIREVLSKDLSFIDEFNIDVQEYNWRENGNRPVIVFDMDGDERSRALVLVDEYLSDATTEEGEVIPKWRQFKFEEYLLYNAEKLHYESTRSDYSFGTTLQLADKYALTFPEQKIIRARWEAYNRVIRDKAGSSAKIHLLDFEMLVERVEREEVFFDGVKYTLDFKPGSIISADGYTLNPRGQALLANELIRLLNASFSSRIPLVDVNDFRGNIYKNGF